MTVLEPHLELTTAQADRLLTTWLREHVECSNIESLKGRMVNSVFGLHVDRPPNRAVVKLHGQDGNSFDQEDRARPPLIHSSAA